MRLFRLCLLPSIQSLAVLPIANMSLSGVLPSNSSFLSNNANITSNNTQSPNAMQVICRNGDPSHPFAIEVDFCGFAISIACRELQAMAESRERLGLWNWVTLGPGMNCVAGFYVPLEARPWMFPSLEDCHSLVFGNILYVCGQTFNVGTMNIAMLPNAATPGTAMQDGYPRYLMASEKPSRHTARKGEDRQ